MSKMIRRRVYFRLPVDFYAENESGMKHAIKGYLRDPSQECTGVSTDHGCYGWERRKAQLDKRSTPQGDGG